MEPMRPVSVPATMATNKAMRAPCMMRESTSRPRLSVPSRKPGSALPLQNGGSRPRNRSCASGSLGLIQGASRATTTSSASQPPASHSRQPSRRLTAPRPSSMARPRVDEADSGQTLAPSLQASSSRRRPGSVGRRGRAVPRSSTHADPGLRRDDEVYGWRLAPSSTMPQPRVERRVGHVDGEVDRR